VACAAYSAFEENRMKQLDGINEALRGVAAELSEREGAGRPAKAWIRDCLKKVKGDDPGAICGNIWHNLMGPAARKRVKKRGTFEGAEDAPDAIDMMAATGEMMGHEPDLEEALSKRHFVRIAEILKQYASVPAVQEIAQALAAFFAGENPQFDEKRFLRAAGAHGDAAERLPLAASADEEPLREQDRLPWSRDPELGDLSV
jgi:hypothetical protein